MYEDSVSLSCCLEIRVRRVATLIEVPPMIERTLHVETDTTAAVAAAAAFVKTLHHNSLWWRRLKQPSSCRRRVSLVHCLKWFDLTLVTWQSSSCIQSPSQGHTRCKILLTDRQWLLLTACLTSLRQHDEMSDRRKRITPPLFRPTRTGVWYKAPTENRATHYTISTAFWSLNDEAVHAAVGLY